jgi:hypothetical protein
MGRRTEAAHDCLPQGLRVEDLKLAKWFLDIVATVYPGPLHSHATTLAVPDGQGGRTPTSLSDLFHAQWPHVPMIDILEALAIVGVITPPQQTTGTAPNEEANGYAFRLRRDRGQLSPMVSRGRSAKLKTVRKSTGSG